jgi:Ca2+-binding RTX toxin-like protein
VNDVWSYTGIPYFDQAEADFGSYRFVMGPSLGDILAVQNLYGANQIINLNAEAFFIGGLTNNIAIARGVAIEAGRGGDGADSMLGNAGDNILAGNAGGDTLDSGAGSDSLYGGASDDLLITDGIADCLDAGDGDDVILLGGTQLADLLALFGPWG